MSAPKGCVALTNTGDVALGGSPMYPPACVRAAAAPALTAGQGEEEGSTPRDKLAVLVGVAVFV